MAFHCRERCLTADMSWTKAIRVSLPQQEEAVAALQHG